MMYRRAALALAGTVGLLVLFGVEPYKALLEERMGWRPSESPARALSEDRWHRVRSKSPSRASRTLPINQYGFIVMEGAGSVGPEPTKFMGATAVPNQDQEKIVLAPFSSDQIGVIDGCEDCLVLHDISAQISGPDKFTGACAIEDDGQPLIIFAPGNADSVGIFNPNNESFRLVDISDKIDVDHKFWGCAVAPNGKIVFAPANGDAVGIFTPWNDEFELVDISIQIHSMFGMFVGAVAAPNGKIIFVPGHAHSVGVFDQDTYDFALVPLPPTINPIMDWKWAEGALAPNGKVVFAPCNADAVGVFDPVENTMELVDISAKINSTLKFWGAATTNGKIIFAPLNADAVGAFFPAFNELPGTFELLNISAQVDMDAKYAGAVTAPYPGAIETMFVPHNAGNIAWFVDFSDFPVETSTTISATTVATTGGPITPGQPSCSGPSCGLISIEDLGNGMWRLSRGNYENNEEATLTLYGPGTVVFTSLSVETRWDYLDFGPYGRISGYDALPADMQVPEGPVQVVWKSDGSETHSGWSFDFLPTTSTTTTTTRFTEVKLRLKVKGKSHLKAWMKVKIVDGAVTASGKVKESHRRRRRRN